MDSMTTLLAPPKPDVSATLEYGALIQRPDGSLQMQWDLGSEVAQQAIDSGELLWAGEWVDVLEVRSRPVEPPQTILWQSKECPWAV